MISRMAKPEEVSHLKTFVYNCVLRECVKCHTKGLEESIGTES